MFQTTRRHLALWYTTVTAILLLLFASGFYWYVRGTLIERIDDTLNHVVEVMQRSLVIEPTHNGQVNQKNSSLQVNVEASFRTGIATEEDDHIDLEWFSTSGQLLWSTLSDPFDIPLHPSDGETVRIVRALARTSDPDVLVLRQVTQAIAANHQVLGYLRVSHPWFEVTKPTRRLFFDLTWGTALMVATVAAIGWWLSGLAMEPVRESYQRLKQFTADASHELRNPIAVIQTNVQVALSDPDPNPAIQQQHLRVVERLTRRLGRLVDNLLFLTRQDSGMVELHRAPVAIAALLQEIVQEQQPLAQDKPIDLTLNILSPGFNGEPTSVSPAALSTDNTPETETPETVVKQSTQPTWSVLYADRDQLARLFTNLISNALQYTPARGQVWVELQQTDRSDPRSLQIKVKDTGIGIPDDALPHVFDRFYRVDPARTQTVTSGSGLGLAIAQAIVDNHQGQIQINSSLNQGTTVTVTLPITSPHYA